MPNPIEQKFTGLVKKAANEVKKFVKENPGSIMVAEVLTGGAVSATVLATAKAAKDTALATAIAGAATADAATGHTISGTAGAIPPLM